MKLLVTAFEPFGGDAMNASGEILRALPDALGALRLETLCLPVSFRAAPRAAIAAAERLRPDAIVCLGQAGGRDRLTPERIAVNRMDAARPDNDGFQPVDAPVVPGGPKSYASALPVEAMTEAMRAAGVPADLSDSAGTYVCNCLMYALLHRTHTRGPKIPCGFLHLPYLEEQRPPEGTPSLPKETVLRGVLAALETLNGGGCR